MDGEVVLTTNPGDLTLLRRGKVRDPYEVGDGLREFEEGVREDVAIVRVSPLVAADIEVLAFACDVRTALLRESPCQKSSRRVTRQEMRDKALD